LSGTAAGFAAAARYVDVYMEAIRWDNAAKLYERYSRET
jgi:Fe-Mn family superoxide dismutase